MPSNLPDDNQDPLLPYWTSDRLSSPIRPAFLAKDPFRRNSKASTTTSASNMSPRSSSRLSLENGLGRQDTRGPPANAGWKTPPGLGGPVTHLRKSRFSVDSIYENANVIGYSGTGGSLYNEGFDGVGPEEDVDTEIGSLLEELTDFHSTRRDTMTSVPLVPLLEEISSIDEHFLSRPHVNPFFTTLLAANTPYNGDSDTPSLISSSPRSSKGSPFLSASPRQGSRGSFTPTTPPTDGWRSPPTLAIVPERGASSSDYFAGTKVPSRPRAYSFDPRQLPEDVTRDVLLRGATEDRRTRHSKQPPLAMTIPRDATVRRRARASMPSGHRIRVEPPTPYPMSSRFSDDDASGTTQTRYIDPGFEPKPAYLTTSTTVSPHFTRPHPQIEVPPEPMSGSPNSGHPSSPILNIGSGPIESLSLSSRSYPVSPKRGVFQSLFPNSEQKKERKRTKAQDQVQTQSSDARSTDSVQSGTSSSKSSKAKKNAEKAAKRAQLAVQLKARQLQQDAEKSRGVALRVTDAQKSPTPWEENGGLYGFGGFC